MPALILNPLLSVSMISLGISFWACYFVGEGSNQPLLQKGPADDWPVLQAHFSRSGRATRLWPPHQMWMMLR